MIRVLDTKVECKQKLESLFKTFIHDKFVSYDNAYEAHSSGEQLYRVFTGCYVQPTGNLIWDVRRHSKLVCCCIAS